MNKDGRPRPARSAEAPRPALAILPVARVKIQFGQGQPGIRLALVDNDPRMHEFVQEAFGHFLPGGCWRAMQPQSRPCDRFLGSRRRSCSWEPVWVAFL